MKLKEVIVVEGKNDTNVLQSYLDCDTIETHGSNVTQKTLELIAQANELRGVIVFTDPDVPGEKIRGKVNAYVKNCKNAFIAKDKAKTAKKVGVEHASKKDVLEALSHLMTYDENIEETLSREDFIDLGLQGEQNSSKLREKIGKELFIGKPNAKTLYKRLNMLQLHYEDILKIIKEKI